MSEGATLPGAPSSAAGWRDLLSAGWRDHLSAANAAVRAVNTATGASWRLDSRFATGLLDGAWRIRDGSDDAVLKWHAPGSSSPYNPDAPAIVEFLRGAGYPTPPWLSWGTTPDGVAWSVQEFVDGEPLRQLDIASADIFLDLVRLQRTLTPPTNMSWNPYMRDHVFGEHERHRRLAGAGDDLRALLDQALELAAPYESANLPDADMVHFDLNVSNILVRNGGFVAVVDIDGTGRGCAVYDLLSPAINGVYGGLIRVPSSIWSPTVWRTTRPAPSSSPPLASRSNSRTGTRQRGLLTSKTRSRGTVHGWPRSGQGSNDRKPALAIGPVRRSEAGPQSQGRPVPATTGISMLHGPPDGGQAGQHGCGSSRTTVGCMATAFLMDTHGRPHVRGDRSCPACWDTYPDDCDLHNPACPGLMHAHATEMRGDKQMIDSRCDQCGRDAVGRRT